MQPEPPEVAGVAGAVPILGPACELGAARGFPGPPALHRSGVHHPHVIGPHRGVAGQYADQPAGRCREFAQPLVVARLLGQVGEQVPQMLAGGPQPAGLGGEPGQGLQHRERDQLGVGEFRGQPGLWPPRPVVREGFEQVVGPGVQCGGKGVQIGVHEGLPRLGWVSSADPGHSPCFRPRDTPGTPARRHSTSADGNPRAAAVKPAGHRAGRGILLPWRTSWPSRCGWRTRNAATS